MSSMVFATQGKYTRIQPEVNVPTTKTLAPGMYVVQNSMEIGFFLEEITPAPLPKKIYGNPGKDADRILNTFALRSRSTGVLLSGDKGSGKTMLTRLIAQKAEALGMPTLIVNQPYAGDGFNAFLNDIEQDCVVLFDEFEKVYDHDAQQRLLTLMDGVLTTHKLFLLTANDHSKVEGHMRNRPGRLFYMIDYSGLTDEFIREYAEDNLLDKTKVGSVVGIAGLFYEFNFDMLQAIIEEMNRYGESASQSLRMLNCKPQTMRTIYEVTLRAPDGEELTVSDTRGNYAPLLSSISNHYGVGKKDEDGDFEDWKPLTFTPDQITQYNASEGTVKMRNAEGFVLTLTKEKEKSYDFQSAYSRVESVL